jgi:acid phosphatase type 7
MRARLLTVASALVLLGLAAVLAGASDGQHHRAGPRVSAANILSAQVIGETRVGARLVAAVKGPKPKTPRKLRFQWVVCDWTGGGCGDVPGATRQKLGLGIALIGRKLQVRITIVKPNVSRTLTSRVIGPVLGAADPVIAAAGDIACDPGSAQFKGGTGTSKNCRQKWTSDLLVNAGLSAVLPLGDDQYECGFADAFKGSYDPSWGRVKAITRPAIGNHEYGRSCKTNDAGPYFAYFGQLAGRAPGAWYSYDVGTWHLVALNSECGYGSGAAKVGGCGAGSPQETWLRQDLAAHQNACTLAYWHEPRFSSGEHGDTQSMATIWNDLVTAHADVVLSGHNHDYERFDPIGVTPADTADASSTTTGQPNFQDPVLDPNGIRQFVVGTGGKNHYGFGSQPPLAGEVVRDASTYGVLKLTLHPNGYDWQFVNDPGSGSFTDSGTAACH